MKLSNLHLSLTDNLQFLSLSLGLSLGLAGSLDGLNLSLNVVELPTFLLGECEILNLSLLQCGFGLLLILVSVFLGFCLLHLSGDFDGQCHQFLQ
jgi:hypothetical protein